MTPPATPQPADRPDVAAVGGHVAALFDEHARMVLGLCRFLLRDPHEAEDAAQQTFLSAYRSMLGGTEPRKPAPWLAEIARNECRARVVSRMREPLAPADAQAPSHLPDPAEAAGDREQLAELEAAIAGLPDRQREAVVLRDFYGLSYGEVATALAVSVPVVESLLFRARRRLKTKLGAVPRLAYGVFAVPLVMREELARAVPGFDTAAAGLGAASGAGAAAGALAKLASLPAAAKIAAATAVSAVAVGGAVTPRIVDGPDPSARATVASVASSPSEGDHSSRLAPTVPAVTGDDESFEARGGGPGHDEGSSSGPGSRGRDGDDLRDENGNSGPGGGRDEGNPDGDDESEENDDRKSEPVKSGEGGEQQDGEREDSSGASVRGSGEAENSDGSRGSDGSSRSIDSSDEAESGGESGSGDENGDDGRASEDGQDGE